MCLKQHIPLLCVFHGIKTTVVRCLFAPIKCEWCQVKLSRMSPLKKSEVNANNFDRLLQLEGVRRQENPYVHSHALTHIQFFTYLLLEHRRNFHWKNQKQIGVLLNHEYISTQRGLNSLVNASDKLISKCACLSKRQPGNAYSLCPSVCIPSHVSL